MLLEVYHDSSRQRDYVTLCGVAATQVVWRELEVAWEAVLRKHNVKNSLFHMTDLMSFSRSFSRRQGWDEAKRRSLLADLFNVVGRFRGPAHHLIARSCTVAIDGWSLARQKLPTLPNPEAMCVNFCVGGLSLPQECADEKKPVSLYFDRDEKFMHTVRRVWERRKKQPGKFNQIATIEKVTAKHFAVQVADLLAWIANLQRPHREEQLVNTLKMMAMLMITQASLFYDHETIMDHYPQGRLRPHATN